MYNYHPQSKDEESEALRSELTYLMSLNSKSKRIFFATKVLCDDMSLTTKTKQPQNSYNNKTYLYLCMNGSYFL
jgi:hypothetical protein